MTIIKKISHYYLNYFKRNLIFVRDSDILMVTINHKLRCSINHNLSKFIFKKIL